MGTLLNATRFDQIDFDLTTPSFFAEGDPLAAYKILRDEDPVHWTKGRLSRGFWSVTRYREAQFVYLNDDKAFSIQMGGNVLPANTDFEDPETDEALRLTREGANLSAMDGEPHNALRKAFSEMFGLNYVKTLEELIRRFSVEILNGVLEAGACDFATDVAAKLPLMVIAHIMAIDRSMWDDLYLWNNMFASPDDAEWSIGTAHETSIYAFQKINETCVRLAHERRNDPAGNDLLSVIARTTLDGHLLSDERLGYNGLMFFAAGHETTRNTLCAGLTALIDQPDEMARLRALRHDPEALKVAVEEFVRWTTPLNHNMRSATADMMLGDRQIRAGDRVVVWNVSANRDERAFENPDRFDCQRKPNKHLGFAMGKHFCLGAHLARLEMRVMLEYLLEHLHDIEPAGPVERCASNLFPGIKHMPIRFRPTAKIALSQG